MSSTIDGFARRPGEQTIMLALCQRQGNRVPRTVATLWRQPRDRRPTARVGQVSHSVNVGRQSPHRRPKICLPATGIFAVSTSPDTDSVI